MESTKYIRAMTLDEAYKTLGLTPLDEFIASRDAAGTRLGATTWMLVSAALEAIRGSDVLLIGSDLAATRKMVNTCLRFIGDLSGITAVHRKGNRTWYLGFDNGGSLSWSSYRIRNDIPKTTKVYRDDVWAASLRQRLGNPYHTIRRIVKTHDDVQEVDAYLAYDAAGSFVLELDEDGARTLLQSDAYRIETEGW